MKTMTINLTPSQTVTLTFSESAQKWDLFSGNVDLLDKMAAEAGYNFDQSRERLADWAARNADIFVSKESEKSTDQIWAESEGTITDEQREVIESLKLKYGMNDDLSGIETDTDGEIYYHFIAAYGNGYACIMSDGSIGSNNLGL